MNLYNENMVQELINAFGTKQTADFCKMFAHLHKVEHKDAFDDAFYEYKWWTERAAKLDIEIKTKKV